MSFHYTNMQNWISEEALVPMGFHEMFPIAKFLVERDADEGVGLYSQHVLHHTDHMKRTIP